MEIKRVILYSVASFVVLCFVLLPGFSALHKLRGENERLRKRTRLLEEYNDKLKGELVKLEQDPEYIEKRARKKLGIVRKGEVIYEKSEGSK